MSACTAPHPALRPTQRPRLPPAHARRSSSMSPFSASLPQSSGAQLGDRLLPLLRNPLDLVFLGPRVALGTLQSLEKIPGDVERLSQLAQDPSRSQESKQAELLGLLEDRVVEALQRGTAAEGAALGSVAAVLPEPLVEALPEALREVLRPRGGAGADAWSTAASSATTSSSSSSNGAYPPSPLSTWTITSDDDGGSMGAAAGEPEAPPMTPEAVAASQTASEVLEVSQAVAALREALAALQSNADASRDAMARLNLREAEAALARRLQQMAPAHLAAGDAAVLGAVREAEQLLAEVEALSL